jgi:hypothetical protein
MNSIFIDKSHTFKCKCIQSIKKLDSFENYIVSGNYLITYNDGNICVHNLNDGNKLAHKIGSGNITKIINLKSVIILFDDHYVYIIRLGKHYLKIINSDIDGYIQFDNKIMLLIGNIILNVVHIKHEAFNNEIINREILCCCDNFLAIQSKDDICDYYLNYKLIGHGRFFKYVNPIIMEIDGNTVKTIKIVQRLDDESEADGGEGPFSKKSGPG